ncbi:MAG: SDR family oxidoreductase [Bacteroidota bacterium]|nr:SDR family oxidoreductase [Bacteroidota bacterium]
MKNIVITGGTRGIGLATVQIFAAGGYNISFCARNYIMVEKLVEELRESYPNQTFFGFSADITVKEELQLFAKKIIEKFEHIHLLINNAGMFEPGGISTEEEGVFERQIATNVAAAYHLTRAILPVMQNNEGNIINIGSTASFTPYVNGGSYCISKFALLGFSKVLREELKPRGIRVTSVLPGATLTDSWEGTILPQSRFMQATHVARALWDVHHLPATTVVEELVMRPMQGDI